MGQAALASAGWEGPEEEPMPREEPAPQPHPTRSMVDQVREGSPYSQPDRSSPSEADPMVCE